MFLTFICKTDLFDFLGARQEEEKYRQHKEQKKLGAVNYVGTPGKTDLI